MILLALFGLYAVKLVFSFSCFSWFYLLFIKVSICLCSSYFAPSHCLSCFFISNHWSLMKASRKGGKLSAIMSARKAQKTLNVVIHLKSQLFFIAAELIFEMSEIFKSFRTNGQNFSAKKKQPSIKVFHSYLVR